MAGVSAAIFAYIFTCLTVVGFMWHVTVVGLFKLRQVDILDILDIKNI